MKTNVLQEPIKDYLELKLLSYLKLSRLKEDYSAYSILFHYLKTHKTYRYEDFIKTYRYEIFIKTLNKNPFNTGALEKNEKIIQNLIVNIVNKFYKDEMPQEYLIPFIHANINGRSTLLEDKHYKDVWILSYNTFSNEVECVAESGGFCRGEPIVSIISRAMKGKYNIKVAG